MRTFNRTEQLAHRQQFGAKKPTMWQVYLGKTLIDTGYNVALLKAAYKGKGYVFKAVY